jgi:GntR family transcriptional regulator, transcriptional repressor for pyruvate dehydrogenase complex
MTAIVDGKLPEGEKLPAETQLASSFGVSRPVVREALSRLRADGVIVSRRGSGSYVQRKPSAQFLSLAPIGGIADLMRCFEFRIALEGETAALAATRRSDKDLAEMQAALREMNGSIRNKTVGTAADIRFHNAVAMASKNKLFTMALGALSDVIFQGITVARKLSLQANMKRLQIVQAEHRRIFEAVRNEDASGARRAVRTHIENARARLLSDTAEPRD